MVPDELHEWLGESDDNRRLMAEETLLLDVTEKIWDALEERGLTKADLSRRLGQSKSHVTQLLNGSRNMTLRTLADIAYALDLPVRVRFESEQDNACWHAADAIVLDFHRRARVEGPVESANTDWRRSGDPYEALEA